MAKRYSKNRRKSRKAIPLLLVLILASMLHTAIPKSVLYDLKAAVKSIMGSLDGSFQGISAQQDAPYEEVNGNVPCFADSDYTTECFYELSELDHLGRCGTAFACFGPETLAEGERGSIGHVRPSGWHTIKYNGIVDGNYLYNRCHLLMWALSGINDDERNLITGTRYMNTEGLLPFEEQVVDYIEETGNHVIYRVTPDFEGDNLVASGVQMEAASVEDDGLAFNVYCYNIQPGIQIDYLTGASQRDSAYSNDQQNDLLAHFPTKQKGQMALFYYDNFSNRSLWN